MSIIKKLYYGDIFPNEKIVPLDEEFRPLLRTIQDNRQFFLEHLPAEHKERFEELLDQSADYEVMVGYANFSYGFRLGMKLAFEAVMGEGKQIME